MSAPLANLSHLHPLSSLHDDFDWVEYCVLVLTLAVSAIIGDIMYPSYYPISRDTSSLFPSPMCCIILPPPVHTMFPTSLPPSHILLPAQPHIPGLYFWRRGQTSTGEFLLASRQMRSVLRPPQERIG